MKKVLLTAFEPFGGETINPSLETARAIDSIHSTSVTVSMVELPVDRHRAITTALEAIAAEEPDVVIMLGEAGGRFRVTPERVAINIDDYRIPDNAGNQPKDESIVADGPAAYFSTLPIRAICERLIEARIPAAISNSAGTYLCNRLFYSVMHGIATQGRATRAGFIHMPYLHDQAISKPQDVPSLSRESLIEAVRLAIDVSIREND